MLLGEPRYVADSVKNPKKIIKKLNSGKLQMSGFVIVFAPDPEQLCIYPAYVFAQKYYKELSMELVGLTSSYDEALEFIRITAENAVNTLGQCDLKEYLRTI